MLLERDGGKTAKAIHTLEDIKARARVSYATIAANLVVYPETAFYLKEKEKEEKECNATTAKNTGISQGIAQKEKAEKEEKDTKEKVIIFMVSDTPKNSGQPCHLLVKDST